MMVYAEQAKAIRDRFPDLPEPLRESSGCKVGWVYYATKEEAEYASPYWEAMGELSASYGFDFGYQSPGQILECPDGTFRVTTP